MHLQFLISILLLVLVSVALGEKPQVLTSSNGAPVPENGLTASTTAGERGPIALKDFNLIDHLAHFARERIPERVVHAKAAGAFGYFEVTNTEITKYCRADLFSEKGKRTPVAIRLSTVGGESGSADTVRDPRGFAVKFYTKQGNWDLVGNNIPTFFIRDPILFPSFIHTQKRNPATHLKDPDMFWDFIPLRPETTHQVTQLFSDRGIPDGVRKMNGFGSHTFKNVNEKGEAVFVKYHWKSNQGVCNLPPDLAMKIAANNPDYSIEDLYKSIERKEFPSWTLKVQIMTFEQAENNEFNPFDVTKIWPVKDFPLLEVGRMVLDRNPKNYFAEVEQLAFSPSHMVPGVEPSPDKMLQGRLFSYPDAQRYRLGANNQQLPVNKPLSHVANYQRDGAASCTGNSGSAPNYFPNSFDGPQEAMNETFHTVSASGEIRKYSTRDDDNFDQAGNYYRNILDEGEKERLVENMAAALKNAKKYIQDRAIENFRKADEEYGQRLKDMVRKMSDPNYKMTRKACSMEPICITRDIQDY